MVILRKLRKARRLARLGFRDLSLYLGADLWHGGLAKLGLSARQSVYRLRAQSSAWPLQVRANSSDRKVFCMIHVDREYAPLDDVEGVRLVVDCGANVGYASAYFLSRFPQSRLIAVEPDDRNFEMLRRNLQPYGDRVTLHNAGVWSHPAVLVICRNAFRDGGAWATQVRECRHGEAADVQATDITTLLTESGCDTIDILKIDIERSELEVFARDFEPWLGHVRNLVIELHDEECHRVFFQALSGYTYDLCQSGELTICRNLQPAANNPLTC